MTVLVLVLKSDKVLVLKKNLVNITDDMHKTKHKKLMNKRITKRC